MDYIEQIEQLFKFLESNLTLNNYHLILSFKKNFNDDLNLVGCFIKDYLTAKNDYKITNDENIFTDFKNYFEKKVELIGQDEIVKDMISYSKHYLTLIFEDASDFKTARFEVEEAISTINALFMIELYPFLMNKFDKFFNLKIDVENFLSMLKSIIDISMYKFENSQNIDLDLTILDYEINQNLLMKKTERLIG